MKLINCDNLPYVEIQKFDKSFRIYGTGKADYILSQLETGKDFYEHDLLDLISKLPLKQGCIIDAGANIGNHTIYFSKILQRVTHSFEPARSVFRSLSETIRYNQSDGDPTVFLYNSALGDTTCKDTLLIHPENSGMNKIRVDLLKDSDSIASEVVSVVMLDQFLPKVGPVALIKIDVEGFEAKVLRGAQKIIKTYRPFLTLECHSPAALTEIDDILLTLDYWPIAIAGRSPNYLFCHSSEHRRIYRYTDINYRWTTQKSNEMYRSLRAANGAIVADLKSKISELAKKWNEEQAVASGLRLELAKKRVDVMAIKQEKEKLDRAYKKLQPKQKNQERELHKLKLNHQKLRAELDAAYDLINRPSNLVQRVGRAAAQRLAANFVTRTIIKGIIPGVVRQAMARYVKLNPVRIKVPVSPVPSKTVCPQIPQTPASNLNEYGLNFQECIVQEKPSFTGILPQGALYDCILLCHVYPGGKRDYGGSFVHSRNLAYSADGLSNLVIEVSEMNLESLFTVHDGINCLRIHPKDLDQALSDFNGRYNVLLSHSPSPVFISLLEKHKGRSIAWLHGFEIRDYRRLFFNYTSSEREKLRKKLDVINASRFNAAKRLFSNPDIEKIFVSNYIRRIAESDVGTEAVSAHIIPNFIDANHYTFSQKTENDSQRILLIRCFDKHNYANDLAIKAIWLLAERKGFDTLKFKICGFGKYFDELTDPLTAFTNISIRKGFLNAAEMKRYHDEHGIFLSPTRFDTQGVTMCEAMASGLACITNRTTAIPEYADETSAVLVRPDDPLAYAEAIWSLSHDPQRVIAMSTAAAKRVRCQCGYTETILPELALIKACKGRS